MLPTPTADDANNATRTTGAFQSLTRSVMLPTPTQDTSTRRKRYAQGGLPLSMAVIFPTPTADDANNCGAPSQMQRNALPLNAMVMLPTPVASSAKVTRMRSGGRPPMTYLPTPTETANADSPAMQKWPGHRALMEGQQLPDGTLPALDPDWVELLMGWPVGWTDLLAATGPATGRPNLELPIGNLDESHD
jgi:hypothetical protein